MQSLDKTANELKAIYELTIYALSFLIPQRAASLLNLIVSYLAAEHRAELN